MAQTPDTATPILWLICDSCYLQMSILFLFLASTQNGFACMGDTRCHDSFEATKRLWVWISLWDPQSGRKSSSARWWVHWEGSFMPLCLVFASYRCSLSSGVLLNHIRKNLTKAANVSAHQNLKLLAYSAVSQSLGASFYPSPPHRGLGRGDSFNPFWLLYSPCSDQEDMHLCLWLGGMCSIWHHSSGAPEENSQLVLCSC